MAITGIDSHALPGNLGATPSSNVMGKDDFLQLLVTQLQHQDPLNPMQSNEFTTQLAQFSSLEQLYTVNDNLAVLKSAQAAANNAQAVSMIGKSIRAMGDGFHLTQGTPVDLRFSLHDHAAESVINIFDAQGNFIRTLSGGALSSGEQRVSWDGKDAAGNSAAGGHYRFEVVAADEKGNLVGATRYITGVVSRVAYINGAASLIVDGLNVPMNTVVSIAENENTTASNESIFSWMNQPLEVKL